MPITNDIYYQELGSKPSPVILWAHGWGQQGSAFKQIVQSFEHNAKHIMIDFPGFGQSPMPPYAWDTADYADAMASFIKAQTSRKVIWVGHSFGCRVGLQIAARHPDLIEGLFLIAGAGLPRKRAIHQRLNYMLRVYTYKGLKKLTPLGLVSEDWLKSKFGSADYRNAGEMRDILVKTVNEDLSDVAGDVTCPVQLIYGSEDAQTPPEIGKRLNRLIKHSEFIELAGLDHYSILGSGRHQVSPILKKFIETLNKGSNA